MGRPRGSKNRGPSWAGDRFSVYLSRRAIIFLESEIAKKLNSKDSSVVAVPNKGLSISHLIAECVDYVIDEGKLQYLPSLLKRK